jgi:hypothetical protein
MFERVGELAQRRSTNGNFVEYTHKLEPGINPKPHADGPFCYLELSNAIRVEGSGVYVVTTDRDVVYVGECRDLGVRFGPSQYGAISARNCHSDGQSTNCKLNGLILQSAKAGHRTEVWFHASDVRKILEAELIRHLKPPWNGSSGRAHSSRQPVKSRGTTVSAPDFRRELDAIFRVAEAENKSTVIVTARELHLLVGRYPGPNHRMPICCEVMLSVMRSGDRLLESPRSGKGASVKIEYRLPR